MVKRIAFLFGIVGVVATIIGLVVDVQELFDSEDDSNNGGGGIVTEGVDVIVQSFDAEVKGKTMQGMITLHNQGDQADYSQTHVEIDEELADFVKLFSV